MSTAAAVSGTLRVSREDLWPAGGLRTPGSWDWPGSWLLVMAEASARDLPGALALAERGPQGDGSSGRTAAALGTDSGGSEHSQDRRARSEFLLLLLGRFPLQPEPLVTQSGKWGLHGHTAGHWVHGESSGPSYSLPSPSQFTALFQNAYLWVPCDQTVTSVTSQNLSFKQN